MRFSALVAGTVKWFHFEKLFERTRDESTSCAYLARVRIAVRAGAARVVREGTGLGSASSKSTSDAHERAVKAAETDATKRALAHIWKSLWTGTL